MVLCVCLCALFSPFICNVKPSIPYLQRMGNIDDAVPFFGEGFNRIYPLIMVIFTILVATNFFDRIIRYFGNWKIFSYEREAFDDSDGFNPSGLVILKKGIYLSSCSLFLLKIHVEVV